MERIKKYLIFLVLPVFLVAFSSGLLAQTKSTVFGTAHDISGLGGGCKGCHVPHQISAKGEVLLWARDFPTTASFGIYNSSTMDSVPVDVGGNYSASNLPTGAKTRTVLCLSCHDGITTPSIIGSGSGAAIANPTTQDGLKNDHPVNMAHNPTADPGLEPIATVQASPVKLYPDGANQTVQCASCHDVHRSAGLTKFLRVANTNTKAGLCTTCHK